MKFDSLGFFCVWPVPTFKRYITPEMLHSRQQHWTGDLPQLQKLWVGQGYKASSYKCEMEDIIKAFDNTMTKVHTGKTTPVTPGSATHGDGESAPLVHQKILNSNVWDAMRLLHGRGAHSPCMWYVGDKSCRSDEACEKREAGQNMRDWGPGQAKRNNIMAREGCGR